MPAFTATLQRHLQQKHPTDWQNYVDTCLPSPNTSQTPGFRGKCSSSVKEVSKDRQKELDEALVNMIVMTICLLPFFEDKECMDTWVCLYLESTLI